MTAESVSLPVDRGVRAEARAQDVRLGSRISALMLVPPRSTARTHPVVT
jgi:hypothetical protein